MKHAPSPAGSRSSSIRRSNTAHSTHSNTHANMNQSNNTVLAISDDGDRKTAKALGLAQSEIPDERYLNMVRTKTVGKYNGISLIFNNMTGIGMIQTSLIFQQSGWLPVTLFFLLFFVISSLCGLFIVEAMQAIPGNRYFQGTVEFGTLINFYFGPVAHIIGQMGLYGALQLLAVASVIQSSQTMDNLFIDLFGRTCGVSLGISNVTQSAVEWYCVTDHGDSISPFGNVYMLFTGGYLTVALFVVPMCIFPLTEFVWVQAVTFTLTLGIFFEWIVSSLVNGLHSDYVPVVGDSSGYAGLVGVVMLNYAFVQTIPAWVNVRRPDVNIQESIWMATGSGLGTYLLTGLIPALAYQIPSNSNLISVMTSNGGVVSKVFGYLFSMLVLMTSIPVLLVVNQSNLAQNFKLHPVISVGLSYFVPWVLAIPFLTGNYLTNINVWGSLIFVTSANFVVPLIIYLKALWFRKAYNERRYLTPKQRDLLKVIHGGSTHNTTQSRTFLNSRVSAVGGVTACANSTVCGTPGTDSDFLIATGRPSFRSNPVFGASTVLGSSSGLTIVSENDTQKSKVSLGDDAPVLANSSGVSVLLSPAAADIPVLILHEAEDEGGVVVGSDAQTGVVEGSSLLTIGHLYGIAGQPMVASPIPTPITSPSPNASVMLGADSSPAIVTLPSPAIPPVPENITTGSSGLLAVPGSSLSLFTQARKSQNSETVDSSDTGIGLSTSARLNSGISASNSTLDQNGQYLLQPLVPKKKVSLLVPGLEEDLGPISPMSLSFGMSTSNSGPSSGAERHSVVESVGSFGGRSKLQHGFGGSIASLASRVILPPSLYDLDVEKESYLLEDVPDPDLSDDEMEDVYDSDGNMSDEFGRHQGEESGGDDFDELRPNPERPTSFGEWLRLPWSRANSHADPLPLSHYNGWGSTPEIASNSKLGGWQSTKNLRSVDDSTPNSMWGWSNSRKMTRRDSTPVRNSLPISPRHPPGLGVLPKFMDEDDTANQSSGTVLNEEIEANPMSLLPMDVTINVPTSALPQAEPPTLTISTQPDDRNNALNPVGRIEASKLLQTFCASPLSDLENDQLIPQTTIVSDGTLHPSHITPKRPVGNVTLNADALIPHEPEPTPFIINPKLASIRQHHSAVPGSTSSVDSAPAALPSLAIPDISFSHSRDTLRKGSSASMSSEISRSHHVSEKNISKASKPTSPVISREASMNSMKRPGMLETDSVLFRGSSKNVDEFGTVGELHHEFEKIRGADDEAKLGNSSDSLWNRIQETGVSRTLKRRKGQPNLGSNHDLQASSNNPSFVISQTGDFSGLRRDSHSSAEVEIEGGMLRVPKRFMTVNSEVAEETYRQAVLHLTSGRRGSIGGESIQTRPHNITGTKGRQMKAFRSIPKSFPLAPKTLAIICLVVTCVTAITNLVYTVYTSSSQ